MPDVNPLYCPLHDAPAFTPCPDAEVTPIVEFLRAGVPVTETRVFPRGTITADGRLDLCKQSVGPIGCRRVTEALRHATHVRSLVLGTDGIGDSGADAVAELV